LGTWTRITWGKRLEAALSMQVRWDKTRAYAGSPTSEGIYINLKGRDDRGIVEPGAEYEELRDFIVAELLKFRDPKSGQPVVEAVYRKEEIYEGEHVPRLPDMVLLMSSLYMPRDHVSASQILELIPSHGYVEGRHRPEGIFMAIGPDMCEGAISGARIIDVAPTILYAMGLPVPSDMDGRVLVEAFSPLYRDSHDIEYEEVIAASWTDEVSSTYTAEESEDMEKKLRGLGYLS